MGYFWKREEKWAYYIDLTRNPNNPSAKKLPKITKGGGKTKKEAQSTALIIELEIENGTFIKESTMPFESFAKDWLES